MSKKSQLTLEDAYELATNKFRDSTSTVDELRHAVFAPINNFTHNSKTAIELKEKRKIHRITNWGEITIEKTLLSQKHKDLFDCIITYGDIAKLSNEPNVIAYKFSGQNMLKKYYGEDTKTKNLKNIDKMLTDMLSSVITIQDNKGNKVKFQLFSAAGFMEEHGSYIVKLNSEYVRFFANSLTVNYKEELPDIIKIKEPIIKAIVRLALTQEKELSMKIYDPSRPRGKTGILEAIGYPIESPTQSKRAFKILKENVDTLKKFGIYYNPEQKSNIRYKKKLDIKFIPPVLHKALALKGNKEEENYIKLNDFIDKTFEIENKIYQIEKIHLDIEKDKIIISCFDRSLETKKIKTIEAPNSPTESYEWISKLVRD